MTTTKQQTRPYTFTEHEARELLSLFLDFISSVHSNKHIQPEAQLRSHLTGQSTTTSFMQVTQASLHARKHRRPSTRADLRSYVARILRHSQWGERNIRSITRLECRQLLNTHFGRSNHIFCKARSILHSIFAYACRLGCCEINPVDGIEPRPLFEERIDILTLRQIRALLKAASTIELRDMEPAVRLMLWCGVRPGEVQRLRWRDIDTRENCVYIEARNSKTGGDRAVPLRGGALQLRAYNRPPDEYIAPRNWLRQWVRLRHEAGFLHWQRDAMRHTFASYHIKFFHNLPLLQEEMGHQDSSLLRTRYLNLRNVSTHSAQAFFKME